MPRRTFLTLLFFFVFIYNHSNSGPITLTDWKSHTSMNSITAITISNDGVIWGATNAGLFSYDTSGSSFRFYRNIDGLLSLDMSAIEVSPVDGSVIAGTKDGLIEILDSSGQWHHYLDIKNAGFTNPSINDILPFNGKIYIAGGFGLTVFDPTLGVFVEDALNLGSFERNTKVNKILIYNNEIWLATDAGIAKASLSGSLSPRSSWVNYSRESGIPENAVSDIILKGQDIYIATNKSISKMQQDTFSLVTVQDILNISSAGEEILYSTQFFMKSLSIEVIFRVFPDEMTGHISRFDNGDTLIIAMIKDNGFAIYKNGAYKHIKPPTPIANQFISMTVAPNGKLWASSDGTRSSLGLMSYDGNKWTNIYPTLNPEFESAIKSSFRVGSHPDGRIIYGTYGSGMLIIEDKQDTFFITKYSGTNAPFDAGFAVAGEPFVDSQGKIWITHFNPGISGNMLISLDKEGNFHGYSNRVNPTNKSYVSLVIDNWGTKWAGSFGGKSAGIYYLNENDTPDNSADDITGVLNASNSSLLDNDITSLAVDKSGLIWVGTAAGASVIVNPSAVLSGSNLLIRKEVRDVRGLYINDIHVDILNNKWIATPEGVFVLDAEGSVLSIINTKNSPIIDNNVFAIESDKKDGRIFFGTSKGLSEAKSLSVEPATGYELTCVPQPFNPSRDAFLIIDGLESDSELRITSINGELIRKIDVAGRKASWDGLTDKGDTCPNGVYLVIAQSRQSGNAAVQKIVVLKK